MGRRQQQPPGAGAAQMHHAAEAAGLGHRVVERESQQLGAPQPVTRLDDHAQPLGGGLVHAHGAGYPLSG
ncbi:hypothetical protein [Streptomyces sp. NPDC005336]|uniref:hypothetical protein n=1 Tax=unclassified Streptomyces TaxID=2593676 RepID=UPI0033A8A091